MAGQGEGSEVSTVGDPGFKLLLRDINPDLVMAWNEREAFGHDKFRGLVEVSTGDIFTDAPAADAIVSPANSFGFMDGGIDMAYSLHFGWQLMERLQKMLRQQWYGELPVGSAVIIPAYPPDQDITCPPSANQGVPIRYLVSAPTMRVPMNIPHTPNSYLALRAALMAVLQHNKSAGAGERISSVLCPGMGTAVGRMPYKRAALQMRCAYEAVVFQDVKAINSPEGLGECCASHLDLTTLGADSGTRFKKEPYKGEIYLP